MAEKAAVAVAVAVAVAEGNKQTNLPAISWAGKYLNGII